MTRSLGLVIGLLLLTGPSFEARPGAEIPHALTGAWAGATDVSSAWMERTRIDVMLFIAPGGQVTGTVGHAMLGHARLERGRNFFGRLFHFGPEWKIAGDLEGRVAATEGPPSSRVVFSLWLPGDRLEGTFVAVSPQIRGRRETITSESMRLDRVR